MAIRGVPTLADIDFGAIRQSRELNFKQRVLADLKKMTIGKTASLSWDGKKLNFKPGASKKMTDTELWNFYTSKSEAAGVPVDVTFYETQLKPFYSQDSTAKLKEDIGSLGMQNIPESAWKKLYKDNPNYQQSLIQTIQSSTPEEAAILQNYTYGDDTEGLVQAVMDRPATTIGGGLLAGAGAKGIYNYGKDALSKTKLGSGLLGKVGRFARGSVPFIAAQAAEPLAEAVGATEDEAKAIRGLASAGGVGYIGKNITDELLRKKVAKEVLKKGGKRAMLKALAAGAAVAPIPGSRLVAGGLLGLDAFLTGRDLLFGSDEE